MIGEELKASDPETYELCRAEERRQGEKIRFIPSENYVSRAVLEASSSVFTNKYSEGYPGQRVITDPSDENSEKVLGEVRELTRKFPAPGISA